MTVTPDGIPGRAPTGIVVGALVANIVSALLCCGVGFVWLPGLILASKALRVRTTDPGSALRLARWSWCCVAANAGVIVIILVLYGWLAGDPGP